MSAERPDERLRRVEELYHAALALPACEREPFLQTACGDDAELRQKVGALVSVAHQAERFLEPAASFAAGFLIGRQVGRYRVTELLGAGGMGDVYRATDARLGRDVALKVLPEAFSANPDLLRRFEQEARAAAALNHPNILAVFDVGTHEGASYIVSELLEGRTLRDVLSEGALPIRDAINYAIQLATGLAAAHEKGIIHRDIKPENVFVTVDGRVKILDFGIAKLVDRAGSHSRLPTPGSQSTVPGMLVGTAGYMSPEQARAQAIDRRTDIWAFGCVLYEMLTARPVFARDTVTDTLAAILEREPDWQALSPTLPQSLQRMLRRCLEKDPTRRLRDIADVQFALEDSMADAERPALPPMATKRPRRRWVAVGTTMFLAGALITSWWTGRQSATAPASIVENPLASATFTRFTDFPGSEWDAAISPDGKFVVFLSDRDGPVDVWLSQVGTGRFTNLTQGREVTGDLNVRNVGISHDGSEIWLAGMLPDRRLRLMPLIGGTPRAFLKGSVVNVAWSPDGALLVYHTPEPGDPMFVADRVGANARQIFVNTNPDGHNHFPVWSPDGRWIYFVTGPPAMQGMDLWRIAPSGGAPERLTHHDSDVTHPIPLDSRTVLYLSPAEDGSGPWLWTLDTERKTSRRASFGLEQYRSLAASADGRRLVTTISNQAARLWTVPILDRPVQDGDAKPFPVPTVRALAPRFGGGNLFYLSSLGSGDGLWRYREKQVLEIWKGANGTLRAPAGISADGKRVAIAVRGQGRMRLNVMSDDGTGLTAVADSIDPRGSASWSPDGSWIATGGRDGSGPGLFKIPVAGGAPVRLLAGAGLNPVWSPDGSLIVYTRPAVAKYSPLLAVRPDGTPVELLAIRLYLGGERYRFLPNGKGLVYMQGDHTSQNFWLLDLTTKKSRPLTRLTNSSGMRTFDITPDGKQILFDRLRDNSDIVLIDLPR